MSDTHRNPWDNRYDHERYFYGESPNHLVARELGGLAPGEALFPAEGEGRNAVFAAGLGHRVTALDNSVVGRRKALDLASRRGVSLRYLVTDVMDHDWGDAAWDLIVMCFFHPGPEATAEVCAKAVRALRPQGRLVHCSFSKAQFGRDSGGPPNLEQLHDLKELEAWYGSLDLEWAQEREIVLDEGPGHRGPAMVIEIVGVKAPG